MENAHAGIDAPAPTALSPDDWRRIAQNIKDGIDVEHAENAVRLVETFELALMRAHFRIKLTEPLSKP
ncbi:MAG: hypothetical protein KGH68_00420 [Patescibacteria group bacterium]|nr:hypothetical protein [Patescibacteria group bacterium]